MSTSKPTKKIVKISHIADCHLKDTSAGRLVDSIEDFESTLKQLDKESIVICAGDFFDDKRPTPALIKKVKHLVHMHWGSKNKHRFLTITGNHDKTFPHWLTAATDLPVLDMNTVTIDGLNITSLNDVPAAELPERFKELAEKPTEEQPDIIVWHGEFPPLLRIHGNAFITDATTDTGLLDGLPERTSFFALGDIHITQYHMFKNTLGKEVLVGYPGSTTLTNGSHSEKKYIAEITYEVVEGKLPQLKFKSKKELINLVQIPGTRKISMHVIEDINSLEETLEAIRSLPKDDKYLIRCFLRKRIEEAGQKLKLAVSSIRHDLSIQNTYGRSAVQYITDIKPTDENTDRRFTPPNITVMKFFSQTLMWQFYSRLIEKDLVLPAECEQDVTVIDIRHPYRLIKNPQFISFTPWDNAVLCYGAHFINVQDYEAHLTTRLLFPLLESKFQLTSLLFSPKGVAALSYKDFFFRLKVTPIVKDEDFRIQYQKFWTALGIRD